MTQLSKNLRAGLNWGVYFAIVFSVIATILVILRGPQVLAEYNTTYIALIASYLLAGTSGGLVAGCFLPLGRTQGGAALVGFAAAVPVSLEMTAFVTPVADWATSRFFLVGLIGALTLGPAGGAAVWYGINRGRAQEQTRWQFITIVLALGGTLALIMHLAGWW